MERIFTILLEQEFYLIKEFEARRLASEKIAFNCYGRYKGSGLAFGAFLSLKNRLFCLLFDNGGDRFRRDKNAIKLHVEAQASRKSPGHLISANYGNVAYA